MTPRSARRIAVAAAIAIVPGLRAHAQTPTAPAPSPATAGFDFSGVIFGNWQMKTDSASKANLGGSSPNLFDLGRAYLTFRMPAGDNGAIRITTDIFQNTNPAQNTYYQGWVVRAKYAYLQYTGLRNEWGPGSSLVGRLGLLHTVMIDYEEQYWPRYLQQTAIEKNGFFSSSDMGLAGLATSGQPMGRDLRNGHQRQRLHLVRQPRGGRSGSGRRQQPVQGLRHSSVDHAVRTRPKPVELPPQHLDHAVGLPGLQRQRVPVRRRGTGRAGHQRRDHRLHVAQSLRRVGGDKGFNHLRHAEWRSLPSHGRLAVRAAP